jgi:hypothetical protein
VSSVFKKYLLIAIVIALGIVANAQMNAVRRWNPRRIPTDTVFAGDRACGECHKKIFASAGNSGMAQAMEPVGESKILSENPKLKMSVGPYTYEITRNGKQSSYSVTDGKDTISFPIAYAFGQGKMGQTYVLERDGKFYESLVSFYNEPKALDFTIGAPRGVPKSLTDAAGRLLSANEVASCFSCHAPSAVAGGSQLRLEKLTHGVGCEACHGPGGQHITAVKAGDTPAKSIFNPGLMSGDELTQQFCAARRGRVFVVAEHGNQQRSLPAVSHFSQQMLLGRPEHKLHGVSQPARAASRRRSLLRQAMSRMSFTPRQERESRWWDELSGRR